MSKDQFELLYHMLLDGLVRITAVENLMMRKKMTTDEEIQGEILSISKGVIASANEILAGEGLSLPEINSLQEVVSDILPPIKKKDHGSN